MAKIKYLVLVLTMSFLGLNFFHELNNFKHEIYSWKARDLDNQEILIMQSRLIAEMLRTGKDCFYTPTVNADNVGYSLHCNVKG